MSMPTIPNPTDRLDCGPAPEVDVRQVVSRLAVVLGQVAEAIDGYDRGSLNAGSNSDHWRAQFDALRALSHMDDLLDHIDSTWNEEVAT